MNIYATGMNPADSNALKRSPRVALFQAVNTIMETLKEENNVTWKATKVGDQIPLDTDAIFVSVMLPRSLNCPYALGAIYSIHAALSRDIPLVLYMTDWAFFRSYSEFRSIAKAGVPYFSKKIGGSLQYNEDPAMIAKHGDDLIDVCRMYDNSSSQLWDKAQVLVPRYTSWGDVNIIQGMMPGANPIHTFDPTPAFLRYLDEDPRPSQSWEMKQRNVHWILPSLLQDDTWVAKQNLEWPIERFGPKGHLVLDTERDVQKEYRRSAGALCPPYPHAGSGWWRSRWIHSARANSVLLCSTQDAAYVGDAYRHSGREYETSTYSELEDFAADQSEMLEVILQKSWDAMVFQIYQPFMEAGAY